MIYDDQTPNDQMKFTTDNPRPTRAMKSDPAITLWDPQLVLHRTTADLGTKILLVDTLLLQPVETSNKEMALSIMGGVMAVRTVTKSKVNMLGIIVESSDVTNYKLPLLSKSVVRPLSNRRSETGRALAYLVILTKSNDEAKVENRLIKWTNLLQLQIV